MLQDLKNGRLCEINAINGVVCEYGKKLGIATLINDKIVEVVNKIQEGELKPELANIEEFRKYL